MALVTKRAQWELKTNTRDAKQNVLDVSAQGLQKKTERRGSLAEFLSASPLRATGLDTERRKDEPRDLPI